MDNLINEIDEIKNYLEFNSSAHYLPFIKKYIFTNRIELTEKGIIKFIIEKKNAGIGEHRLNTFINSIVAYRKFKNLPEIKIKRIKTPERIPDVIDIRKLDTALNECIPKYLPRTNFIKAKCVIMFLAFTGIRKNELTLIKRQDINFNEKKIMIYEPKTKKYRVIFLADIILELYQIYINTEPIEKENFLNISDKSINQMFRKLKPYFKEKFHLNWYPHCLRSSWISYLVRHCKFDTFKIQALSGHKNINSLKRYVKLSAEDVKEQYLMEINKSEAKPYL